MPIEGRRAPYKRKRGVVNLILCVHCLGGVRSRASYIRQDENALLAGPPLRQFQIAILS